MIYLLRQLKTVFTCSRILYRSLESLGLDMTSVIFNHFKKWQQHTIFVISFYQRIIQMVDSRVIHF